MKKIILLLSVVLMVKTINAQITQQGTVRQNQLAIWDSDGVLKAGYLSDYLRNNNGSISFSQDFSDSNNEKQYNISPQSISIVDNNTATSAELMSSGGLYTYHDAEGYETRYTYLGITHFGVSEYNLIFDKNTNSRDTSNKKTITIPNSTGTIALTDGVNTTNQVPFWDAKGVLKSSNNLVVKNGNVGIGTTNPEEKLHIYGGTASIQGNIGVPEPTNHYWRTGSHTLELQNDDRGDVVLSFHRAGASNAAIVHPTSGGLKFSGRGIPTDNHMFMSSTGNLGIGTANPRGRLDLGTVVGAGKGLIVGDYFSINERDGYNNATVLGFNARIDPADKSKFFPTHAADNATGMLLTMHTGGQASLDFYGTNWKTRTPKSLDEFNHVMRLAASGNVGIGIKSPQAKLHIKNEDNTTSAILGENSLGDKFIVKSDKFDRGGGITKRFFMGIDDNGFKTQNGLSFVNTTSGDFELYYEQEGSRILSIAPTTASFRASDSYGSTKFNFVVEGNVNSQTIKTSERIHIGSNATYNKSSAYSLSVEGKAIAEEIKVQKKENWSDFVFYDDYKLPTLKEVESHIAKKGHLKDIPSAKEVAKEGFFLGEMDAKLLQKIEELTLYTIAQEKKIEALEQENKTYKKVTQQLNDLLKRVKQLERN